MLVGIAIEIPFAIGEAVLGVEAYLIRYQNPLFNVSQIFDLHYDESSTFTISSYNCNSNFIVVTHLTPIF